eukprot:7033599-Pyramimonas_sp.AAC.1
MLDDKGDDKVWARFARALDQWPRNASQLLGVNMANAEDGPTAEPEDWDDSVGRKPTEDTYVDRNAPAMVPMAR